MNTITLVRRPSAPSLEILLLAIFMCVACLPRPHAAWQLSTPFTNTVSVAQPAAVHPLVPAVVQTEGTVVATHQPMSVHVVRAAAAVINAASMGVQYVHEVEITSIPITLPHASGQCGEDSGVPCTPLTKLERLELMLDS